MTTRTVRADNFALSEDTKRQAPSRSSRRSATTPTREAVRLLEEHREALERLASKLLERETLDREDVATMLHDVQRVGTLAFTWSEGPGDPRASGASCCLRQRRHCRCRWPGEIDIILVVPAGLRDLGLLGLDGRRGLADARRRARRDRCSSRACRPRIGRTRPRRTRHARPRARSRACAAGASAAGCERLFARLEGIRRLLLDLVEQAHAASHRW